MDSLRGRKTDGRGQLGQLVFEDYQPLIEWGQDPENHLLRVVLPDFKREEVRVQVDNSGKLVVRGRRQTSEGKLIRVEKAFEVPKDAMPDKISGRFEDGCLFLVMPRIRKLTPAAIAAEAAKLLPPPKDSTTSSPKPPSKDPTNSSPQEKSEEPISTPNSKPNVKNPKLTPPPEKESTASSPQEKKVEEPAQIEKPNAAPDQKIKEREEECVPEKTNSMADDCAEEKMKEEEIVEEDKAKNSEEERKRDEFKNAEAGAIREKGEEMKKKAESLYQSIENEVKHEIEGDDEGWFSGYGLVLDDMLETIKKNRRVIVVAVVAFSVGFCVSRKLRSSG